MTTIIGIIIGIPLGILVDRIRGYVRIVRQQPLDRDREPWQNWRVE